jgi:hypothetical protein
MPTPEQTAGSFRNLDFHDDSLIEVSVLPGVNEREGVGSAVKIYLQHHSEKKGRVIRFIACANLRVAMDFDILCDNFPANTSGVKADASPGRIRNLIEVQKQDWDVQYANKANSPIDKKLNCLVEFVFFRVQFFGGVVEVVAREYNIEPG